MASKKTIKRTTWKQPAGKTKPALSGTAQRLQATRHALNERIKEQECIYAISRVAVSEKNNDRLLRKVVALIPPGWQFPEITKASIRYDNLTYRSTGFRPTVWKQTVTRKTEEGELTIDVCYLKKMPDSDEGPFLKFERRLLNTLADQLVIYLSRNSSIRRISHREEELRLAESKYKGLFEASPAPNFIIDQHSHAILDVNKQACRHYGYSRAEMLNMTVLKLRPEKEIPALLKSLEKLKRGRKINHGVVTHIRKDGSAFFAEIITRPIVYNQQQAVYVQVKDVTEGIRKHSLELLERNLIRAVLKEPQRLSQHFSVYIKGLETILPGSRISILKVEQQRIFNLASPSLPVAYLDAIEGLPIGPAAGSCGTAAFRKKQVIVTDIRHDPLWAAYRKTARQFGLKACWSTPVFNARKEVIATFATYPDSDRRPSKWELEQFTAISSLIAMILESAQKDRQLQTSHERFLYITKAAGDAIWDWDLETGELFRGRGFAVLLGKKNDRLAVSQAQWEMLIHPDDREKISTAIKSNIEGKASRWEYEYRITRYNGETAWVWDRAYILRNNKGKAIRLVGAIRDISNKRKEEQQLRLLQNVITNSNDALLITKPATAGGKGPEIIYVNRAFCRLTGYPAKELIGNTPQLFQGALPDNIATKELLDKLQTGKPVVLQTVNYRKNGEPYRVEISVTPVKDDTGNIVNYFGIERDITRQYQVEMRSKWMENVRDVFNHAPDLKTGLLQLLNVLNGFGKFMAAEVWVLSPNKRSFQLLASHANNRAASIYYQENKNLDILDPENGLLYEVLKKKSMVIWDKLDERDSLIRKDGVRKAGFKAALSLPLLFNGEVTGALTILSGKDVHELAVFSWLLGETAEELGAELKRKQLEDELNLIFTVSPDILAIASQDGFFKKISPAAIELLGYAEEELLNTPFISFVHRDDVLQVVHTFKQLDSPGQTVYLEIRCITKQGNPVWLAWTVVASSSEGYLFGVGKNITQTKSLQLLLDNANRVSKIGAWEFDMQTRRITWSDVMREIHEVGPGYIPDENYSVMFFRPDMQQEIADNLSKPLTEGRPFDLEFPLITAKGNERWIRAIGTPEYSGEKCIRMYGSFQDIHVRKKAELELAERTGYLSAIAFIAQQFLEQEDWFAAMRGSFEIARSTMKADQLFFKEVISDNASDTLLLRQRIGWMKGMDKPVVDVPGTQDIPASLFPEVLEQLLQNRPFTAMYSELPASPLKQIMAEYNLRSILFLPVFSSGELAGVIGVEDCTTEHTWTEGELFFLRGISAGLSAAIQRARNRNALNELLQERNAILGNIQQSSERFERVMEATNDAIWDFDLINRMVYLGPGFRKNFGHAVSKEWIALDASSRHVHPEDQQLVYDTFMQAVGDPESQSWICEFRIMKAGGDFADVINRSRIIRDPAGKAVRVVGALTDITYQKEYERSLRKLNESLEKQTLELSASNKELEQFAYVASHDLQEPLRMVTSFLSKLNEKYAGALDERGRQYIHFAVDGAKRMRQNILDLLQYSRVGKGNAEAEEISLSEVMDELCLLHNAEITASGARIIYNDLPVIRHYIAPVTQVFNNLLNNALKYRKPDVPPEITVEARPVNDAWEICIRDNGIGIEPEYLQKIFVIFQRLHTKENYPGTGIGLAVVKKVVENQGGRIWVTSEPGKGSAFYFTLLPVRD